MANGEWGMALVRVRVQEYESRIDLPGRNMNFDSSLRLPSGMLFEFMCWLVVVASSISSAADAADVGEQDVGDANGFSMAVGMGTGIAVEDLTFIVFDMVGNEAAPTAASSGSINFTIEQTSFAFLLSTAFILLCIEYFPPNTHQTGNFQSNS